jgi:hypothetical protein
LIAAAAAAANPIVSTKGSALVAAGTPESRTSVLVALALVALALAVQASVAPASVEWVSAAQVSAGRALVGSASVESVLAARKLPSGQ